MDLSDALAALGFAFLGGDRPVCLDACDFNADGTTGITNGVYLLGALFLGGPAVEEPRECGFADALLGCEVGTCAP